AVGGDQPGHPVPAQHGEPALGLGLTAYGLEGGDQPGAGAPGDVEAGHGVAVAGGGAVATLRPSDDREEALPLLPQPVPLLPGGPLHVGPGPAHGLGVLVLDPVEPGAAGPVLPGQLHAVVDPHPAL